MTGSAHNSLKSAPNYCYCSAAQLWPKFQAYLKAPADSEEEGTARVELLGQLKVGWESRAAEFVRRKEEYAWAELLEQLKVGEC